MRYLEEAVSSASQLVSSKSASTGEVSTVARASRTVERRNLRKGSMLPPASVLCLGLVWLCAASLQAQETETTSQVRVEKRVIMVDEDGKVVELEGDGVTTHLGAGGEHEAFVWVSEDGDLDALGGDLTIGLSGGFLGVETVELTEALRDHFGVPTGEGVMVSNVVEDSGAMLGGVAAGDVITAVAGTTLSSSSGLGRLVRQHEPGETIDLEIWRDGKLLALPVQLGERQRSTVHLDREGASSFKFRILGSGDEINTFEFRSEDAVEDVLKYFDGPEWRERVRRLETMDLDQVEARMRELEAKIKSLEKQLEEDG